jgi:RNase H-fold protein (predicted Holliday junction resolvase)
VAGLDPGRSKCGLVQTDPQRRRIVEARVLAPAQALEALRQWQRQGLALVVLGNGTGHRSWQQQLEPWLPVALVEERDTTLAARERYWRIEPARGWRRWLPRGLRQPPRDWDDVVAQILVERWLSQTLPRQLAGPERASLRSGHAP